MVFLFTVMPARPERRFGLLARQPSREDIDEHQVIVGAAGHEAEARVREARREARGVGDDLLLIRLECRRECLSEADRLSRDDVHERAALHAGEHRAVDVFCELPRDRGSCRRVDRAGSCAWSWSRSPREAPGSDGVPSATRPAMCAMSTMTSAPTSSATLRMRAKSITRG